MAATIIARTITIVRNDDGSIRNVQGDMWKTTDDAGATITPKHIGTKNGITAEELGSAFPNADLVAQISQLQVDKSALETERDALVTKRDALTAEKTMLTNERDDTCAALKTMTAIKDTVELDKAALTVERNALKTERDALAAQAAQVEPLKAQLRILLKTPIFRAADLLAQITDAEKDHTTQFVAGSDTLRPLWSAFLSRVVGPPIAIDSQTFLAALDGLRQALGETRVAELFTALNIDLATGEYIDPTKAL